MNRKEEITALAKQLFKEKGYMGSSMRDLAQRVGIEAASLYNHFKSKEELLQKICFDLANEYMENLETLKKRKYGSVSAWLESAMHLHLKTTADNIEASSVFLNEWRFLTGEALEDYKKFRKNYEDQFRNAVLKGTENREFRNNLDPKITTISILSALNWTANWFKADGKEDIRTVANQLFDLTINGLKQ